MGIKSKIIFSVFALILLLSSISAIRINEVEVNPIGTDAGNEWIELYNEGEISLGGYTLFNGDGKNISINDSFNGYFVYTFTKQWLDNSNESLSLYNGSELIDRVNLFVDSKNDDLTSQFCSSGWKFINSTKGKENNCIIEQTLQESVEENEEQETNETVEETKNTEPYEYHYTPKATAQTITLEPITLNIKSEEDKEILKKNLAIAGIVSFCLGFGALFFLKTLRRRKENEFR